jgi:hypothetical protein
MGAAHFIEPRVQSPPSTDGGLAPAGPAIMAPLRAAINIFSWERRTPFAQSERATALATCSTTTLTGAGSSTAVIPKHLKRAAGLSGWKR